MIKPHAINERSTIGLVAPSYWMKPRVLKKSLSFFESIGFKTILGKTAILRSGSFAGTPEERAQDLMEMFLKPSVEAIVCIRGGYGMNRVLPLLDYDIIKKHPKIVIGYSDITSLLTSITQRTELVTFHGPMLISFKNGIVKYNVETMLAVLGGKKSVVIKSPSTLKAKVLSKGIAEGPLLGGNMTLIQNQIGTKNELNTAGSILFLEDINERYYSLDRLLVHLKNAGVFDNIRGLIIGEMVGMKDEKIPFGKTVDEIVMDVCGDLKIPIVSNFPCGHGTYQATLPLSIHVRLNASKQNPSITILGEAVE